MGYLLVKVKGERAGAVQVWLTEQRHLLTQISTNTIIMMLFTEETLSVWNNTLMFHSCLPAASVTENALK